MLKSLIWSSQLVGYDNLKTTAMKKNWTSSHWIYTLAQERVTRRMVLGMRPRVLREAVAATTAVLAMKVRSRLV
ncbi:hypothetical protein F5B17DRAFT_392783 [Nemania serpens]|nr:hypothetical protein F5B17DRAFT_392783 [Nemania serpens]